MAEILIDSYSLALGGQNDRLSSVDFQGIGQGVTGAYATLTRALFSMRSFGTVTGNVVAKLYTHTGTFGSTGLPGTLLATSDNVTASSIAGGANSSVTFTFSGGNQYALVSGTKYFLTVEYNLGDASNNLGLAVDLTPNTHGGNAAYLQDTAWVTSTNDVTFELYGNEYVPLTPVSYFTL